MHYLHQKLIFTLPYATIRFFYSLLFCLNKLLVTKGGGHFDRKIKGVSPYKTEKKTLLSFSAKIYVPLKIITFYV